MELDVTTAVVAAQVGVFQFLAVRFFKAVPEKVLEGAQLTDELRRRLAAYKRGTARRSYGTGALLLAGLAVSSAALSPSTGAGALAVAAVSVTSSVCLLLSYLRAHRAADAMASSLPESRRRIASLERRTLSRYYNPALELIPFAVLAASVALAAWALPKLTGPYPLHFDVSGVPDRWGEGIGRFVALVAAQATATVFLLYLTFATVRKPPCLSPKAPRDPEIAGFLAEAARKRELLFFLGAKILIALQFALTLFVKLQTALGTQLRPLASNLPWLPTIALMLLFAAYIYASARSRTPARRAESAG